MHTGPRQDAAFFVQRSRIGRREVGVSLSAATWWTWGSLIDQYRRTISVRSDFVGDPTQLNLNLLAIRIAHLCEWNGRRKLSTPYPTSGALDLRDGDFATSAALRGFPKVLDPAAKYPPADSL